MQSFIWNKIIQCNKTD